MNTNLYFLFWGDALFEKINEKNSGENNFHIKFVENSLETNKHCIDFIEVFGGKYSLQMNDAENSLGECNIHIKVVENSLESDKHCIDFIEVFGGNYSLHINVVENSLGEYNIHMIIIETFVAKNINHFTCIVWKDENNQ